MGISIREATKDDADALALILTASWKSAYKGIIPDDELEEQTDFEQRRKMFDMMLQNPRGELYIAYDNIEPCGQFMFSKSRDAELSDYAEIVSIYASDKYWSKGVGPLMMKTALLKIAEMNYTNVMLWVFKDNARARKFYEKFGFVLDGAEKKSQFSSEAIEVRYVLTI